MDLIIIMIASFCIGQIIPEVLQPFLFKIKKKIGVKRLKPIDCSVCLSFWFTLFLALSETSFKISILSAVIVFSLSIKYELNKIKR